MNRPMADGSWWQSRRASVVRSYGLAIASVAAAEYFVYLQNSHLLFFPPIVVSAWYGGIGPGLLAVFLSILGNSFHLTPAGFSLRFASLHDVISILVWSFTALFVAWLTAKHREVVASLRNNEAKLEEAQRVAHLGYWENDLDTDRITWSDETYHILGLRPNEDSPTAAEFQERIHPEDRQLQAEAIARAYRGESRYDIEYRVVRPDGEVRTVRSVGDVVRDASGRPCRAFGVVQDITERKRAQEALWASERKFRALFESSHEVIVFLDRSGNILEFNPLAEQLTGYTKSELSRMNVFDDLLLAEDQPLIRQVVQDAFEGRTRTYEERWKTKGGDTIWFEGVTVPRQSPNGEVISTFCTLRDITGRRLAEEKLRQSERDLAEAQRVAGLGNWRFDIATNTFRWSEELYRIFEVDKAEFGSMYESFMSRVHPDDKPLVLETNRRARETGEPFEVEYRIVTRAGQLKHIREVGYTVKDATGGVVGLFGTAQDITRNKQAEEKLRDNSQLVREMAAHLVQIDEAERRKLSQELHDHIGQTLTALNIHLTFIRSQVTSDLRDKIVPRIDDSLALADEAISRIRDVISDLRPPVLDDYGLLAAFDWYGKQFAFRTDIAVKVKGQELSPRPDPNVETVLFRIVQEALTNIAKHAKATKVVVIVTRKEDSLCLLISDDGIGFHPSEQTGSGRQRGWGLITMKERSESLGGSFRIESRPRRGSRVVVKVPR